MPPSPLYSPESLNAAFLLRYSWTGWFSGAATFNESLWNELDTAWKSDGLHRLEASVRDDEIHVTVSALPSASPAFLAHRIKGRLKHALGPTVKFARNLSVRSLGDNRSQEVTSYIARQVGRAHFADERFARELAALTEVGRFDWTTPSESLSGRYWHNLHLVLVSDQRLSTADLESLRCIFDGCARIAEKKGYQLGARSVLPDHVHLALRAGPEDSPESVALSFLNNLAFVLGQKPWWTAGYYAGTFGEYDMRAVRQSH
jgi:REP element-mobilizing transposase RayT